MEKFLRDLERASLNIRGRISGYLTGNYKSSRLGDSYDFYGIRPYYTGDDIKNIDWKAFGRTGKIYTKLFTEQKQINAAVLLDNSRSMALGQPSKWETAKLFSIGIGYIILKELNRLNVYSFNDSIELNLHNLNGKKLIYYISNELDKIKPGGGTDFKGAASIDANSRGIIFIITDLLGDNINNFLDNISQRYEKKVLIHIIAREELYPEFKGRMKLIDMETGEYVMRDIGESELAIYRNTLNSFVEGCKEQCEKRGIKYIPARGNASLTDTILKAVEVE
ncbi:hypothetical protein OXPF_27970 [Oxobacter pfennigii]|uniref:DUF58 domain-containing protein n=1 Tax=Oxobacter pfennigii TaxID=36849 RepID=A0A0P8YUI6_9CLOT|nr:DUF58 domain-containing protein [Oxobacter pfennigii]KPU43356.1 hypothetical protein OXPF_27970 [Oxobacter pfennigii]